MGESPSGCPRLQGVPGGGGALVHSVVGRNRDRRRQRELSHARSSTGPRQPMRDAEEKNGTGEAAEQATAAADRRDAVKLALISDVHGNLEALEAVLLDIDRISPDAKLVCAGDVVGYGPDPEACIARLREREALCVMGNHEEMVLGYRDFSRCVHAGIVAAVWTREHLSAAARAFLDALPHRREAAAGVVVCHGDLSSAETYVSTREKAEEALAQLRAISSDAAVLVCGHTHQ